jgi:hypothetical protein
MKRITHGQADIQRRLDLAKLAGVNPTPATLHRIINGFKISRSNLITYSHTDGAGLKHYEVGSQTDSRTRYHVMSEDRFASCTCGDWHYHDMKDHRAGNPFSLHLCKHGLAVKLWEVSNG